MTSTEQWLDPITLKNHKHNIYIIMDKSHNSETHKLDVNITMVGAHNAKHNIYSAIVKARLHCETLGLGLEVT